MISRGLAGQLLRYGGTTLMSASVSFGLPLVLHEGLGVAPRLAVAIGFVCAFLLNFVSIRKLVFAKSNSADLRSDFIRFAIFSLLMRCIEYLSFLFLFGTVHLPYVLALGITLVFSTCIKFPAYKLLVFARKDKADDPSRWREPVIPQVGEG